MKQRTKLLILAAILVVLAFSLLFAVYAINRRFKVVGSKGSITLEPLEPPRARLALVQRDMLIHLRNCFGCLR